MDSTLRENASTTTREVSRAFAEGKVTKDEALKLALDALSPDPYRSEWIVALDMDKAITAIKEALAQQEQKPVAWVSTTELLVMRGNALGGAKDWRVNLGLEPEEGDVGLYTTPPQRTWVGLTDEDDIDWEDGGNLKDLVKAIEAKLKEKNT